MTATVILYLLVWVPLVFAGRALGRRWGNPDAGFWLPVLLGVLGFAMFTAIAVADGAVSQSPPGSSR